MNSRRKFLAGSAATSAAALALSAFPPSIRRALATLPNNETGTIMDVKHVVIFMQENRSFDHYYGTLRGVRGYGDPRPHILPDGRAVWYQPPASAKSDKYQSRGLPADANYVLPFYIDPHRTEGHHGTVHDWSTARAR